MNSSCPKIVADLRAATYYDLSAQKIALSATAVSIWALRFAYNRARTYRDARVVLTMLCILKRSALISHIRILAWQWQTRGSLIAWSCALAIISWWACRTSWKNRSTSWSSDENEETFLRPFMIPSRTTHSRFFPTKHSFSYSYLFVGIPMRWRGPAGSILSADSNFSKLQTGKTWFSVVADDYLERGTHKQGLDGKLRDYLASQNVSPDKYPHAYLVTAPRFLGISFNPVSFWYLYDSKKSLAAMILEVNNTFDERRMYFMERRVGSDESENLGLKFAQEWPKDFHVSPFNDRGGAYSVQSTDPFHASEATFHKVDNNIVLKSKDGKPKIIARVFSTEPTIDARTMTTWDTFRFVLRWWWVGFMTNPRILKEARTLWAKKLQIYYRPEVLNNSIGRNETPDEVQLEIFFRDLLDQLTVITRGRIHYTAAAGLSRAKQVTIRSTWQYDKDVRSPEIELLILTPAFYDQLVRYRTLLEAFDRYCFQAADGKAMVHCTHPGELREALIKFSTSLHTSLGSTMNWHIVANLGQYPILQPLWQILIMSVRGLGLSGTQYSPSDFDVCVLRSSSRLRIGPYYKVALKMLLADRVAFGWLPVLKLEETCVWLLLVLAAASASGDLLGSSSQCSGLAILTLLKLCGIHMWSAIV